MSGFLSDHSVLRYQERVRPALSLTDCRNELTRLTATSGTYGPMPSWVTENEEAERFLLVGDAICLPIRNNVAVTCLVRGTLSEFARQRRNQRNRQERKAKRARRQQGRRPEQDEAAA